MTIDNKEIASIFDTLADLLEIEGDNKFRVRAYREAASSVRGHAQSMSDLLRQGEDLSRMPNIGDDLAGKIATIVDTGKLPLLEQTQARLPASLSELMQVDGLGPKRVKALYEQLGIRDIDDLEQAVDKGEIRHLRGFGEKTEKQLKHRLQKFRPSQQRTPFRDAESIATKIVDFLQQNASVKDVVVAGSFRRRQETQGDLDILITAKRGSSIMEHFLSYDEIDEVVSKGETRSTVQLKSGIRIDLRVVQQVSYGAALHYFTGSKAHNIAVRKIALNKGLKLNEYGVFKQDQRIAGKTEEEVYDAVDLPFILPELRENRGEIQAARKGRLPELIALHDLRGDLHCHTDASDGHHSLQEMAQAAIERGYEYLSINDHSKHLTVANGLDRKRLLAQIRAIDDFNDKQSDIVLLKSIEVDILQDGALDLPDSVLERLDFTICSIHDRFNLSRREQTDRILRAMDHRCFNILAHPTGRLINHRDPYPIDLESILHAAKERGCFIELNAHPARLDLNDEACKFAKDLGVRIAISTDAHQQSDLDFMRFGVNQARRGWIEPNDVLNCQSIEPLLKLFKRE